MTHALASLPFGMIPCNIFFHKDCGGVVRQTGCTPFFLYPIANDFSTLAPYVFPTMTVIMISLRPLIKMPDMFVYDLFIGVTFGYHTLSTIREFFDSWSLKWFPLADTGEMVQSDIAETGIIYSTIYIITVTLAIHDMLLAIMIKGYPGIHGWHCVFGNLLTICSHL